MSGKRFQAITTATRARASSQRSSCDPIPGLGSSLIHYRHSRVPGRVRFVVATLYRSESVKRRLETGLRCISGITSVKGNVLTGNLLVVFARERSADEIAVLILQQLDEDSPAAATPNPRKPMKAHVGPECKNALLGAQSIGIELVGPASLIYVPMGFLGSFLVGLLQMSPILIFLTLSVIAMGQIVGGKEGWSRGDALYFSFITATTVGYGDLRPTKRSTKALSVGISFVGMVFTGIVAAIGLHSAQHAFEGTRGLVKP